MDTLPEEMLLEIMEYLRHSDLKCFRLVCKKFYEASLTFRIVNRDNVVYDHYNIDDCMKIFTTERNFYHFHFVKTDITVAFREFVEKRAEFILSLKFDRCKIMYDPISFCESINKCIKLKTLQLHYMSCPLVWNSAATISLPALESMDISGIPDDMFNVLMNTNVKNLHLCVDYYHHLKDVIRTRGSLEDLKSVGLLYDCTDAQLTIIADNLNLTTISVSCCDVTDRGIKYFVEKQRGLRKVELSNPMFITDESLVAIAENSKDLKELIFFSFDEIEYSFDALNRIINFTPVRCLNVCGSIYVSGLVTTVGDVPPVSKCLRQLNLWGVQNETHVTYIAENFLSLTELELMESDGVTTQTLQLICQNLKNLKKLNLLYCNAINGFENDVSQLTFSANFKNLEELDLSGNRWLSDSILETCFKLSSLRILIVSNCEKLTVKSFVDMPKNFPCLETLEMSGLKVDNDVLLSTVSLMNRLCKLTIGVSEPITELQLKSLYEHSDFLHRVNFDILHGNKCYIRSWERKTFIDA